ncbi:MAG TPA: DMT family transporter [Beijerinckiaceae bacterium]|nr:DMT family transporter [Beijerinckiaceae bacterium]
MNSTPGHSQTARPLLLLTLTGICWAGNTIAGRMAVGEASPMAVTALRWIVSFALMSLFVRAEVRAIPALLRRRPLYLLAMGILGFTGFNALYYIAAHSTTAINLGIMQASTPLFVLAGAAAFHGVRASPALIAGLLAGIAGVVTVVSGGRLETLAALAFKQGDLLILATSLMYAVYSLGIRDRPQDVSPITFFAAMAFIAALTSLPLVGLEMALGAFQAPTLKGWAVIIWVAVFPSLLAQLWYISVVATIGANRAGFIFNLIPIFASILAVILLGEDFGWHHAAGLALVLGGIAFAERFGKGK